MTESGPTSTRRRNERPYKGIRMRKWGKWVAEIREPNKRSRIWLGSYSAAIAAARAYDTAVYYLRGPTAKLNFPGEISSVGVCTKDLSAASIRKRAAEVGARVDAMVLHGDVSHQSGKLVGGFIMRTILTLTKSPSPSPNPNIRIRINIVEVL